MWSVAAVATQNSIRAKLATVEMEAALQRKQELQAELAAAGGVGGIKLSAERDAQVTRMIEACSEELFYSDRQVTGQRADLFQLGRLSQAPGSPGQAVSGRDATTASRLGSSAPEAVRLVDGGHTGAGDGWLLEAKLEGEVQAALLRRLRERATDRRLEEVREALGAGGCEH